MIFSDTSFLVAAMDGRDPKHDDALKLLRGFGSRRIVTTNLIRGETWTWLRCKCRHRKAIEFLDSIGGDAQHIQVSRVGRNEEGEALHWLRRHDEREYSFVDATSFAFMRAKGIEEALAFDGDFAAAGFVELRP